MKGHQFFCNNIQSLDTLVSICNRHGIDPVTDRRLFELVVMDVNMTADLLTDLVNAKQYYSEYKCEVV